MPNVTFRQKGHMKGDVTVAAEAGESILDVARRSHVPVGYACGGNCACSTCHVYVRDGVGSLDAAEEGEENILDMAFDVQAQSRLSCQVHVKEQDLVVEITDESYQAYLNEHAHEAGS